MKTLVVMPTYNEAANIATVLRRLREAAAGVDVLVVDDGSPDGTAALAQAVAEELGHIQVIEHAGKRGLGAAYRDGFRLGLAQGYQVFVEMDADLSHDPATVPALVAAVRAGADLAIGTRYMPGGSIPDWSWHRRAISKIGNWYAGRMLRIGVSDSTSGFRAYHRRALLGINLADVRADGYGFQIEMAYRVRRNGGRIREIPICFRDRQEGQSKMSFGIIAESFLLVTRWGIRDRFRPEPQKGTDDVVAYAEPSQ